MLLVNLSNLVWVPKRMKRNQAIFQHLLAQDLFTAGIYVHPPTVRNLGTNPEWRLPYAEGKGGAEAAGKRIDILQPVFTLPFTWRAPVMKFSATIIARSLKRRIGKQRYALWMNSIEPLSVAIAAKLAPAAEGRIFDSSDDFVEFEPAGPKRAVLQHALARVLRLADGVLAVNEHVCAKLDHHHKRVFQNCTDFDNFQRMQSNQAISPYFPKPEGSRYVGFIGGLNRLRVDLELLEKLFTHLTDCRFLFVGYTNDPAIQTWLSRFPNASFVPEVPYDVLPTVIRSFDVAVVPHLDNENTRGNDLLKMLDYFACGVPVVTTRCSNVEKYAGACHIADGHEDFMSAVKQLIAGTVVHDPEPGIQIARSRTWVRQVQELLPWVMERLERPRP